jgi:hypothetical protein
MTPRATQLGEERRMVPVIVFVTTAAVAAVIGLTIIPEIAQPAGGPELGPLKDHQQQALAITLEMNKLVISLGSLILGAVGAIVVGKEDFRALNRLQIVLALTTLLGATSALFLSYVVYDRLVEMLSNKFLALNDGAMLFVRSIQVDTLGISVVALAGLFVSMVSKPRMEDVTITTAGETYASCDLGASNIGGNVANAGAGQADLTDDE